MRNRNAFTITDTECVETQLPLAMVHVQTLVVVGVTTILAVLKLPGSQV